MKKLSIKEFISQRPAWWPIGLLDVSRKKITPIWRCSECGRYGRHTQDRKDAKYSRNSKGHIIRYVFVDPFPVVFLAYDVEGKYMTFRYEKPLCLYCKDKIFKFRESNPPIGFSDGPYSKMFVCDFCGRIQKKANSLAYYLSLSYKEWEIITGAKVYSCPDLCLKCANRFAPILRIASELRSISSLVSKTKKVIRHVEKSRY